MEDKDKQSTRRHFIKTMGAVGGSVVLYKSMAAMGLLPSAQAYADTVSLPKGIGAGKHVIVLGAGVAGLTTAYELLSKGSGYKCTVLEANPHVGGRCLSLRNGDVLKEMGHPEQRCTFESEPGQPYAPYLNAGPGRIPSAHKELLGYMHRLDIPIEIYMMESRSNLIYSEGGFNNQAAVNRRVANDTRGWLAHHLYPLVDKMSGLDRNEQKLMRELLIEFGKLKSKNSNTAVYEGSSRSGYTRLPSVDEGVIETPFQLKKLLASQFWKHHFYQPEDFLWQQTLFEPIGGMDKIVKTFAEQIHNHRDGNIELSAPVVNVEKRGRKVLVTYTKGGRRQSIEADYCICNIPIPLLADLNPRGLSEPFANSLRAVGKHPKFLASTCKIGWQANRTLWQQNDTAGGVPIFGGISWTSHQIAQMWYPSSGDYDKLGVLTGAYNFGSVASRWGTYSPKKRLQIGREGAKQLGFKNSKRDLRHGITIAWQNMPYQKGGWTQWQNIPKGAKHYNVLLQGDNNFFICGDQLSQLPGWQEGAVYSAQYVLRQMSGLKFKMSTVQSVPDSRELVEGSL